MKMPNVSLLSWQKRFGTEKACAKILYETRWPSGFMCPNCDHHKASSIKTRKTYQCSNCRYQVSITAGTLLHSTNLSLVKWFWAFYLVASDKGGISALRLSKHLGVSWPTARSMLKKIRTEMAHRDSIYRLVGNMVELDEHYCCGKNPVKRPWS